MHTQTTTIKNVRRQNTADNVVANHVHRYLNKKWPRGVDKTTRTTKTNKQTNEQENIASILICWSSHLLAGLVRLGVCTKSSFNIENKLNFFFCIN